jgi:anti-sigma factor RsiW
MATCSHADRLIPLLHDNELQSPLRREMVAHMATCVACARTFSLLEREQELFTQAVEERVDSIDFSNFWQAVETRLVEPSLSWTARLRLWYESWHPVWSVPVPAWAVAALLLFLIPTQLSLNNSTYTPPSPVAKTDTPLPPSSPSLPTEIPQSSRATPREAAPLEPQQIQPVGFNDNQTEIESIYTYGPGAVSLRIHHDPESNSTVILYSDGTSEYPQ